MAEVPNYQILNSKETLEALLSQKKEAPVKLVYAAKKTHEPVTDEAEMLEEFRMDLLQDFAETDEEGNVKQQTDGEGNPTGQAEFESEEDMREFQERLNEIYSDSSNIDAHTVDIDAVGDHVAPASWAKNLDFMFEGFNTETKELVGGEVQASIDSVESILGLQDEEDPELPLKFSAGLFQTYQKLAEAQADIENRRLELLEEYAERDEDGGFKTDESGAMAQFPSEEAEEDFQEELNEVYNEEFEVEAHLVEVDYTEGVNVHPRHAIILDWMLTD
jgi:hypothetical protein